MTCTLPDLQQMMKRTKIEMCERVCPEHRIHIVRDGKVRDDLRIEVPWPPAQEEPLLVENQ